MELQPPMIDLSPQPKIRVPAIRDRDDRLAEVGYRSHYLQQVSGVKAIPYLATIIKWIPWVVFLIAVSQHNRTGLVARRFLQHGERFVEEQPMDRCAVDKQS